jgi:hypothetical protein
MPTVKKYGADGSGQPPRWPSDDVVTGQDKPQLFTAAAPSAAQPEPIPTTGDADVKHRAIVDKAGTVTITAPGVADAAQANARGAAAFHETAKRKCAELPVIGRYRTLAVQLSAAQRAKDAAERAVRVAVAEIARLNVDPSPAVLADLKKAEDAKATAEKAVAAAEADVAKLAAMASETQGQGYAAIASLVEGVRIELLKQLTREQDEAAAEVVAALEKLTGRLATLAQARASVDVVERIVFTAGLQRQLFGEPVATQLRIAAAG